METLGNRIQKLREENNLNKEQFGKSIGITGTGLNNYEKDLRSPSADIIAKICEVYGVSADYLLFGVSAENRNICEVTGLSNRSIENLIFYNNLATENISKEEIKNLLIDDFSNVDENDIFGLGYMHNFEDFISHEIDMYKNILKTLNLILEGNNTSLLKNISDFLEVENCKKIYQDLLKQSNDDKIKKMGADVLCNALDESIITSIKKDLTDIRLEYKVID